MIFFSEKASLKSFKKKVSLYFCINTGKETLKSRNVPVSSTCGFNKSVPKVNPIVSAGHSVYTLMAECRVQTRF